MCEDNPLLKGWCFSPASCDFRHFAIALRSGRSRKEKKAD
jgi:hypothetical protein